MNTFILDWNPAISDYTINDFENSMFNIDFSRIAWSIHDWRDVKSGDNFFLVKCGEGKTGIVMSGFFESSPHKGEDWSGKGRETYYIECRPQFMIHPDNPKGLLSTQALEEALPEFQWNGGHSGRMLPENIAASFRKIWNQYISGFSETDFDAVMAARNMCPPGEADDAIELISSTYFDKKDMNKKAAVLHYLAVGMAGKTDEEMICGFLHGILKDSETDCGDLRRTGFSEDIVDTIMLLTPKKDCSFSSFINTIAESGNRTAVHVEINALSEEIRRHQTAEKFDAIPELESALETLNLCETKL